MLLLLLKRLLQRRLSLRRSDVDCGDWVVGFEGVIIVAGGLVEILM